MSLEDVMTKPFVIAARTSTFRQAISQHLDASKGTEGGITSHLSGMLVVTKRLKSMKRKTSRGRTERSMDWTFRTLCNFLFGEVSGDSKTSTYDFTQTYHRILSYLMLYGREKVWERKLYNTEEKVV